MIKKKIPKEKIIDSGDADIDSMLKRLHGIQDDIEQKIDQICEVSGKSRQEIKNYLENPDNIPPEQMKRFEKQQKELEDKVYAIFGKGAKKKAIKKKKKKLTKKRKGKMLGARKKWIPMK